MRPAIVGNDVLFVLSIGAEALYKGQRERRAVGESMCVGWCESKCRRMVSLTKWGDAMDLA